MKAKLKALRNILIGLGCLFGIHWSGQKGLGMFGDASRCAHCGADSYGLLVIRDKGPGA